MRLIRLPAKPYLMYTNFTCVGLKIRSLYEYDLTKVEKNNLDITCIDEVIVTLLSPYRGEDKEYQMIRVQIQNSYPYPFCDGDNYFEYHTYLMDDLSQIKDISLLW